MIDISKTVLETSRLILRPFLLTDLDDFYEYASVDGVGEMAGWVHHESCDESKRILELFISNKNVFAIVNKANNKVIGSLGLEDKKYQINSLNGLNGIEIGYVLSKDYWGLGLMTEAVKKVIFYIFLELKLDYVTCGYFKRNLRSKRVFDKNGFKYIADIKYETMYKTVEDTTLGVIYRDDYLDKLEKIQLYDLNGNKLDKWIYRGQRPLENTYAGVVDIIIKNTKYDKYLLTKRDKNKESYPNYYETTGGAISYLEDEALAARREVLEETGIKGDNLTFLYTYKSKYNIHFEYYLECDCNLFDVVLQDGETADYVWLDKLEYLHMWQSDLVVDVQKERLAKALSNLLE